MLRAGHRLDTARELVDAASVTAAEALGGNGGDAMQPDAFACGVRAGRRLLGAQRAARAPRPRRRSIPVSGLQVIPLNVTQRRKSTASGSKLARTGEEQAG